MRKIKTIRPRKLSLVSETLRQLTTGQLAGVAGGLMITYSYCAISDDGRCTGTRLGCETTTECG
jgi:hypothetical protein